MRRLIIGAAAVSAALLLGCKTDSGVAAGYSSEVQLPERIAQNPELAGGERGLLLSGIVVIDYKDNLILEDSRGIQRSLRIQDDTVYRAPDGDLITREYLEPGARVRAAFDYNNKELIAREIIVDRNPEEAPPAAWPENPSPYPPNP